MRKYLKTIAALLLTASVMTSANAEIIGKNYAEIRPSNSEGWSIQAYFNGSNFHSCGATTADSVAGMDEMILEYTGFDWQIGRNEGARGNYQGRIIVGPVQDTLSFEPAGTDVFIMVAPLQRSVVAEIKRGASLSVQWDINDQYRANYSLSGSTAAMLKVEECVQNQGRKRTTQRRQPQPQVAQQPRPRVAQQPQPRRNTVQPQPRRQNDAPLKAQLSGTWVWSDPVKNSKNNLIISTIRMTGSNTVNYCYGVFCWDVNFSMNARNEISFSTNGTDKFTFYEDGPNALHGEFWEFGNSFASPDARVDLR